MNDMPLSDGVGFGVVAKLYNRLLLINDKRVLGLDLIMFFLSGGC
jgi:hypothetical protein